MNAVPEYWPTADERPPQPRVRPYSWLGLPTGVISSLMRPKSSGPRVAITTWFKVLLVHAVGVAAALLTTAVGMIGILTPIWLLSSGAAGTPSPASWTQLSDSSVGELICQPLATAVNVLFLAQQDGIVIWPVVLVPPMAHLLAWPAALALAPLFATGERFTALYGRTLKTTLWSTAVWMPGFALVVLAILFGTGVTVDSARELHVLSVSSVGVLVAVWWLFIAIRLGLDCRPQGKLRWEPRIPRCEGCSYRITGLPATGRCPECGRPVAESMPDYRQQPAWALARGAGARLAAYFRTNWTALRDPQFFHKLAVYRGRSAAIGFAATTAAWAALLAALSTALLSNRVADGMHGDAADAAWNWVLVLAVGLIAGIATFGFVPVFTLLVARFGRRDPRPVVIVACYGMASILPTFLTVFLLAGLRIGATGAGFDFRRWIGPTWCSVNAEDLFALLIILLPLGMLCLGLRRVFRAMRGVKIANG